MNLNFCGIFKKIWNLNNSEEQKFSQYISLIGHLRYIIQFSFPQCYMTSIAFDLYGVKNMFLSVSKSNLAFYWPFWCTSPYYSSSQGKRFLNFYQSDVMDHHTLVFFTIHIWDPKRSIIVYPHCVTYTLLTATDPIVGFSTEQLAFLAWSLPPNELHHLVFIIVLLVVEFWESQNALIFLVKKMADISFLKISEIKISHSWLFRLQKQLGLMNCIVWYLAYDDIGFAIMSFI